MDPVQRLLVIADRERRKHSPAPAASVRSQQLPALEDQTPWQHQRRQQAIVQTVRAGRGLSLEERAELQRFAKVGMTEVEALAYLVRKYVPTG